MEILLTTWTKQSKNTSSWLGKYISTILYLLQENGSFILQETGDKILLEQNLAPTWTKQTVNTASWTKQTKN